MDILDYIPSITVISTAYHCRVRYDNLTDYITNEILNIKSTEASDVIINNIFEAIYVKYMIDCMSINDKSTIVFNTYTSWVGTFTISRTLSVTQVLDILIAYFPEFKYIPLH